MKFKIISQQKFEKELSCLHYNVQMGIFDFLRENENKIDHYEYAKTFRHKMLVVVFKDGLEKMWRTRKQ